MDSITQFVLGAAVGEATLKPTYLNEDSEAPRFGLGAFLLGGLMGTLPDLDVLARPFLNGQQALGFHRGASHSLFFCTLAAWPLALLLKRIYSRCELTSVRWYAFVWLALNTHWMIDSLTTYGTQVFLPFSNRPVNIGSVFIIDPLYTVPLLLCTLWSLFQERDGRPIHPTGVRVGLAVSTLYLVATLCSKYIVWQRFEKSLQDQQVEYQQMMTTPTPFNSLLWYCCADTGEDVWVGYCSLLDPPQHEITWRRVSKNRNLFPGFGEGPAGQRLLWFSRGYYRLLTIDGKPAFADLRFGRLKSWFGTADADGTDYVFLFLLKPERLQGPYEDFSRRRPDLAGEVPWRGIYERALGREWPAKK
jgi:inner membrane protein